MKTPPSSPPYSREIHLPLKKREELLNVLKKVNSLNKLHLVRWGVLMMRWVITDIYFIFGKIKEEWNI